MQRVSKTKTRASPRGDIKELMKMRKTLRKKVKTTKEQTEKIQNNKRAYNRQEKRK